MRHDPLDLPATVPRIRAVARAASFPPATLDRALRIATATPEPAAWERFLARALAFFGVALLLAGVTCFVAYNWTRIGRFGKFALLEVAIIAAAGVAWWRVPRVSGQLALTAAAVLVGPLLAVHGQTYQTGADPYGLFLTWVVLIAPWVVAARFSALWVFALLLLDLGVVLFWVQAIGIADSPESLRLPLLIAAVQTIAVVGWEWQYRRADPWLTESWAARIVVVIGVLALWVGAVATIIVDTDAGTEGLLALSGFAAAVGYAFHFYRHVRLDRFMVTVAVGSGMALAAVAAGRLIFAELEFEAFGFILMAAFVILEITVGLSWYKRSRGDPAADTDR